MKMKKLEFPWGKRKRKNSIGEIIDDVDYRSIYNKNSLEEGVFNIFGHQFRYTDGRAFIHSVEEIFVDEVYRFHSEKKSPIIIDAGANIGLSVLYFKRLYPSCKIIAYEPDPKIFNILNENVASCRLDNVETRDAAAWIEDGELKFFSDGALSGSSEVDASLQGELAVVRAERLKTILQSQKVDFLKIDIEGAENSVMFDIEQELTQVENLFFEYHSISGKDQMLGDLLNIAKRAGFRYSINGTHGARLPFIDRNKRTFDLQLNVSCFRY